MADDVDDLRADYSDLPETLLARVFRISKHSEGVGLQNISLRNIGGFFGAIIHSLNAEIVGICRIQSDAPNRVP